MPYNFLIAAWGSPGHLGPALTAAQQLRGRGHNARFIARPDARDAVEAAGFRFAAWQRTPSFSPLALPGDSLRSAYDHLIFGPAAARAADTRNELGDAPTDALLTDTGLFGSALAAEAAGIPYAFLSPTISLRPLPGVPPLHSGLSAPRTPMEHAQVDAANDRFVSVMNQWLPMLNEARATQGLAPLGHVLDLFDRAARLLLAISAAFDFPANYLPKNVRYIGPLLDRSVWSKPWTSPWRLQESNRPRALVSFSTTVQNQTDPLHRTMNAIAGIEMDALVTLGPALDDGRFRQPTNITLLPNAPHDAIMKEVSLVVTHGCHGTVSRALRHGLPLLVMPMGRDQSDIALRVEARGVGLSVPSTASEMEIAGALNHLIREPLFRARARRLGNAIASDIRSERLVSEMEEIAGINRSTAG
jgi:UDP:flavonoid glycosyltransferase YjiC (YdhE family)